MTCIVALVDGNKIYMGGDSAASDDKTGLIFQRKDPKVFKVGQYGIGFIDSFRMGQILQYSWNPPVYKPTKGNKNLDKFLRTKFIDSIRNVFKEHGYGSTNDEGDLGGVFVFAVQGTGRVFTVDSDFHIGESDVPFAAEGGGQELALGSLYSTTTIKTPRKRVRMALESAAKFNMSVRPPFTIIEL